MKKKTWLKSLLIGVMALLLVVSLVACNKKKPPIENNPPPSTDITTAEYFDKLWTLTSAMGDTKIEEGDDINISLDLSLQVDMVNSASQAVGEQVDLGVAVRGVIGRTEGTADHTQLQVRLYDPTGNGNDILALTISAKDSENLYIDFGGKKILVPNNLVVSLLKGIYKDNPKSVVAAIVDGLSQQFIPVGANKHSINDLINKFGADFGSNWTLDTLVNGVLDFIPSLKTLLVGEDGKGGILGKYGQTIEQFLGKGVEILDENGHVNLISLLKSESLGGFFVPSKTSNNGVDTYTLKLGETIFGMLKGVAPLDQLLNRKGSEIGLVFNEKNNEIDGFSIYAICTAARTKINGVNHDPVIRININDFALEKTTDSTSFVNKGDYKKEIALNENLAINVSGLTINPIALDANTNLNDEPIVIDGKLELQLNGQVDLVETDLANNTTKAYAVLQYVPKTGAKTVLAEASFIKDALAVKMGDVVTNIASKAVGENFKGIYWNLGKSLPTLIQEEIIKAFNKPKTATVSADISDENYEKEPYEFKKVTAYGDYTFTNNANSSDAEKQGFDKRTGEQVNGFGFTVANTVKAVIKNGLALIRTNSANSEITISSADILQTIVDVCNNFGVKTGTYVKDDANKTKVNYTYNYFQWTRAGREAYLLSVLTNPPMVKDGVTKTVKDCIDEIKAGQKMPNVTPADKEARKNYVNNALLNLAYLLAQNVRIEGVNYTQDAKKNYEANIKSVLGAAVTVKADLKDGVHLSVSATADGLTLSIAETLGVVDANTVTYNEVTVPQDKDGWHDLRNW